jgi:putative FmdB family regulatory protein
MPLYEYQCKDCGDEFEKKVLFSEANHVQDCPTCKSLNTRKKISKIAFRGATLGGMSISSSNNCGTSGGFS